MEPLVSVPMANPHRPAAVADAGPAEEPLDPSSGFQGFFVVPPNQRSPWARARSARKVTTQLSFSLWRWRRARYILVRSVEVTWRDLRRWARWPTGRKAASSRLAGHLGATVEKRRGSRVRLTFMPGVRG